MGITQLPFLGNISIIIYFFSLFCFLSSFILKGSLVTIFNSVGTLPGGRFLECHTRFQVLLDSDYGRHQCGPTSRVEPYCCAGENYLDPFLWHSSKWIGIWLICVVTDQLVLGRFSCHSRVEGTP